MASQVWDRTAAADRLRPELWRYLSGASSLTTESPGTFELAQLERPDAIRLFATHLAVREEAQAALQAAARLLQELPSSQALSRVELFGEVRGQVDWARTQQRRTALADPTVFVCTPPERRYDTPPGRLLRLSLWCAAQLADLSALTPNGPVGLTVHETSDTARRMLLHPKLSKVRRVEPRALRHTQELVARRPYVAPLVWLVDAFWAGIIEGSRASLMALLEQQYLAPENDSALFELQVGFDILRALGQVGFSVQPPSALLPAGKLPFASLTGTSGSATVSWQRPAWILAPDEATHGAWWRALEDNGLSRQPLRPDFLIELPKGRRLLVEVKLTALAEGSPERDGLRDVLAYLTDAERLFTGRPHPHALVAAWNARGAPRSPDARIQVADQDDVVPVLVAALQDLNETAASTAGS